MAGDASLRRGYIIPASDVMDDIRATFEHDGTLPNISSSVFNYKPFFPSVEGFRVANFDDARVADDFVGACSVKSQKMDHVGVGSTTSLGYQSDISSRPSNCNAKEWNSIFSKRRPNNAKSWRTSLGRMNEDDNDFNIFPQDFEDTVLSFKAQEIDEFLQGASLEDLQSGRGLAGLRRSAWLDDRSLFGATSSQTRSQCNREYESPLTATGLYRHLRAPVCIDNKFQQRNHYS